MHPNNFDGSIYFYTGIVMWGLVVVMLIWWKMLIVGALKKKGPSPQMEQFLKNTKSKVKFAIGFTRAIIIFWSLFILYKIYLKDFDTVIYFASREASFLIPMYFILLSVYQRD